MNQTPNVPAVSTTWKLKTKTLRFDRIPALMGIVNVTPDSFSDGGRFHDCDAAVAHGIALAHQGASILDVGGESTRPYSTPVEVAEETARVAPVVERLTREVDVPISVDTSKAEVARAALNAGAEIINDVTGLEGDPQMVDVALSSGAGICAMHMQGTPQNMQDDPSYVDVVQEIFAYLKQRRDSLLKYGIEAERICLDPGIGFGKTHEHNFELVRQAARFHDLGCPILVGHSRKGFIARAIGDRDADRTSGTVAVTLSLARHGIQVIRVHDVEANLSALKMMAAIETP